MLPAGAARRWVKAAAEQFKVKFRPNRGERSGKGGLGKESTSFSEDRIFMNKCSSVRISERVKNINFDYNFDVHRKLLVEDVNF